MVRFQPCEVIKGIGLSKNTETGYTASPLNQGDGVVANGIEYRISTFGKVLNGKIGLVVVGGLGL